MREVFIEHASGVLAKRPALDDALDYLRAGDTLIVTKLDRLGRSVRNLKEVVDGLQQQGVGLKALSQGIDTTTPGGRLFFHMLAAIAEFEHDLIVERTKDGLAAARARGRKGGGRFKMTPTKARQARAMYDEKSYTVQQIAETFGVRAAPSTATLVKTSGHRRATDRGAAQRPGQAHTTAPARRRCPMDPYRRRIRGAATHSQQVGPEIPPRFGFHQRATISPG